MDGVDLELGCKNRQACAVFVEYIYITKEQKTKLGI